MEESERQQQHPFGSYSSLKLLTGCYIAPAIISDRHAVYLGIRREDARVAVSEPLSVHTSVTDAWKILICCKKNWLNSSFSANQSDEDIFKLFTESLHNTYGNCSEDGDNYKVSGNLMAYKAWMEKGNYGDKNNPPPGVVITPLAAVMKQRYKVFCIPVKEESNNFFGNPDDNCIFHINEKYQLLIGEDENLFVCNTYVKAAYVADYANAHNKDTLTSKEKNILTQKAEHLFGKV